MGSDDPLAQFLAAAAEHPRRPAVIAADRTWTYGEFLELVHRLAHAIAASNVVHPRVAIDLAQGAHAYAAMLATLSRGGVYCPLNVCHPPARRSQIIAIFAPQVVITAAPQLAERVDIASGVSVIDCDALPDQTPTPTPPAPPDDLAYVIFTSGSTGAPKGVMIARESLGHYVNWAREAMKLTAEDRWSQHPNISFDLSVLDIYAALCTGAALVPVAADARFDLAKVIVDRQLTIWNSVPSAVDLIASSANPAALDSLRLMTFCGEPLLARHLDVIFGARPDVVVHNTYGPTEATVSCTLVRLDRDHRARWNEGVPIGQPIPGMAIYVLDDQLQPVADGALGELWIGGIQVARGYAGRPGLTAERFVANPFARGQRMYRTGDLGRRLPDGTLEFGGRVDHQVKIRGFRIELGEIDAVLLRHPEIQAAVVLAREDVPGDKRLVAYVVAPTSVDRAALRRWLEDKLPEYMVPSAFVQLDALPHTPNGKLDRKALPAPPAETSQRVYVAPRTEDERALCAVWGEVLHRERVGIDDDFFELGGDSLLAAAVVARINSDSEFTLTIANVFEHSTIRGLAAAASERRPARNQQIAKIDVASRRVPGEAAYVARASSAQGTMWIDVVHMGGTGVLPIQIEIRGTLDHAILAKAFETVVARQEALRTTLYLGDDADELQQKVHDRLAVRIEHVRAPDGADRDQVCDALLRSESSRRFDLAILPLFRVTLVELGPDDHVLLLTIHHSIWDGFSTHLLSRELCAAYEGALRDEPPKLPALRRTFAEFTEWQISDLTPARTQELLSFWSAEVGHAPRLVVPGDLPGVEDPTHAWLRFSIEPGLTRRIEELSGRHGITTFMWTFGAFVLIASQRSNTRDVLVGTAAANRSHPDTQSIMGLLINVLLMRTQIDEADTMLQFAMRVRKNTIKAFEHQDLPLEALISKLRKTKRLPATGPIGHMFAFQAPRKYFTFSGGPTFTALMTPNFDATGPDYMMSIEPDSGRLCGLLEYNASMYSETFARQLAADYVDCLEAMVTAIDAEVGETLSRLATRS